MRLPNRLLMLLVAMVALFTLAACGGNAPPAAPAAEEPASEEATTEDTAMEEEPMAEEGAAEGTTEDTTMEDTTAEEPASEPSAGGELTSLADLPLFPEAQEIDPSSPMATVVDAMRQQIEQQEDAAEFEVEAYALPSTVTFADVQSFYDEALTGRGWISASEAGVEMPEIPGGGVGAWTTDNQNEVISLVVMEDPMQTGESIMIIYRAVQA